MGDEEIESLFRCASKKTMRESSKKCGKVRSGVIFFARLENAECLMFAPPQLSLAKQVLCNKRWVEKGKKQEQKITPSSLSIRFHVYSPAKEEGGGANGKPFTQIGGASSSPFPQSLFFAIRQTDTNARLDSSSSSLLRPSADRDSRLYPPPPSSP